MTETEKEKLKNQIESMNTKQLTALWKWVYLIAGEKLLEEVLNAKTIQVVR